MQAKVILIFLLTILVVGCSHSGCSTNSKAKWNQQAQEFCREFDLVNDALFQATFAVVPVFHDPDDSYPAIEDRLMRCEWASLRFSEFEDHLAPLLVTTGEMALSQHPWARQAAELVIIWQRLAAEHHQLIALTYYWQGEFRDLFAKYSSYSPHLGLDALIEEALTSLLRLHNVQVATPCGTDPERSVGRTWEISPGDLPTDWSNWDIFTQMIQLELTRTGELVQEWKSHQTGCELKAARMAFLVWLLANEQDWEKNRDPLLNSYEALSSSQASIFHAWAQEVEKFFLLEAIELAGLMTGGPQAGQENLAEAREIVTRSLEEPESGFFSALCDHRWQVAQELHNDSSRPLSDEEQVLYVLSFLQKYYASHRCRVDWLAGGDLPYAWDPAQDRSSYHTSPEKLLAWLKELLDS